MSEIIIIHKMCGVDISECDNLEVCQVRFILHLIYFTLLLLLSGFYLKPQNSYSAMTQFYNHNSEV